MLKSHKVDISANATDQDLRNLDETDDYVLARWWKILKNAGDRHDSNNIMKYINASASII